MTNENTTISEHVQNAEHALDAYQRHALNEHLPSPPDRRHADALIGALVGDLKHYADACGLDFAEILANARAAYTAELSDQTRYAIGDEVRLITHPQRCGTITNITVQNGEQLHHVHVAGVPYTHAELAADIEPANPFPLVPTSLGVITTARQAEATLVEFAIRARHETGAGSDPTAKAACDRLITALTWWSGTTHHELAKEISPRIAQQIIESRTAEVMADESPVRLARQGFPYDLRDGIPSPAAGQAPAPVPSTSPAAQPHRSPSGIA